MDSNTYITVIKLKINIQLKPKMFLLGLIDKMLEKSHGPLFLYMITDFCMYMNAYKSMNGEDHGACRGGEIDSFDQKERR